MNESPSRPSRWCKRCGKTEPEVEFRSPAAIRCVPCDTKAKETKRRSNRPYHIGRYQAWRRLEAAHKAEFDIMFEEEKAIARQAAKNKLFGPLPTVPQP